MILKKTLQQAYDSSLMSSWILENIDWNIRSIMVTNLWKLCFLFGKLLLFVRFGYYWKTKCGQLTDSLHRNGVSVQFVSHNHINLHKVISKNTTFLILQWWPALGQVSAAQHPDSASTSEAQKEFPLSLSHQHTKKSLLTDCLLAARWILWPRKCFKCSMWGWLSEKWVLSYKTQSACGKLSKKRINRILTMSAILTTDLA